MGCSFAFCCLDGSSSVIQMQALPGDWAHCSMVRAKVENGEGTHSNWQLYKAAALWGPAGSPEMQFWGSRRAVTKSGGTARAVCMGEAQLAFQELGA